MARCVSSSSIRRVQKPTTRFRRDRIIAVRGTEGDIEQSGSDLRSTCTKSAIRANPLPSQRSNGQQFQLVAGQSLAARLVNGIVQAKVEQLTQGLIDQFSPDFGVPTSWDAAKGEIVSAAQNQASNAIDNATGGYGSQVDERGEQHVRPQESNADAVALAGKHVVLALCS